MSRCRFVVALCIIRVLLVSTSVSAEKPPIPPLPTPSPWDTLTSEKTIPIEPFGKARPRFVRRGGTFMPDDYQARRDALRLLFGPVDIPGLLAMRVIAYRPMPQSWSERKRLKMEGQYTTATPDVDNIAGAVMDALFADDARVVSIACAKVWGREAALKIRISSIEDFVFGSRA